MRLIALLVPLLVLGSRPATADEVVHLLDKTKIVGKFLHYFDGMATIQLPNGTKLRLPQNKIRQIQFKLPKPRTSLSTPAKSFKRLRTAALKGDLETYVDMHSTYYQMVLNHQVQIATPNKFVKQLKKEWGKARLEILSTKVDGAMAVLKVRRHEGGQSQDGELRFVKENKEWKMILPL